CNPLRLEPLVDAYQAKEARTEEPCGHQQRGAERNLQRHQEFPRTSRRGRFALPCLVRLHDRTRRGLRQSKSRQGGRSRCREGGCEHGVAQNKPVQFNFIQTRQPWRSPSRKSLYAPLCDEQTKQSSTGGE